MLLVAVALSSSDENAIRYILPVLWMASCFYSTVYVVHGEAYSRGMSVSDRRRFISAPLCVTSC